MHCTAATQAKNSKSAGIAFISLLSTKPMAFPPTVSNLCCEELILCAQFLPCTIYFSITSIHIRQLISFCDQSIISYYNMVAHNCRGKTKNLTAKPKLHSKNKIALVLPRVFAFAVRFLVFAVKYFAVRVLVLS